MVNMLWTVAAVASAAVVVIRMTLRLQGRLATENCVVTGKVGVTWA